MIVCRQCSAKYEVDPPSFCGRCGTDLRRAPAPLDDDPLALALDDGSGVPADPLVGRVVGGRYRVLERIGSGGMGVVYKVEHTAMGKLAALKMLHPTLSADREVVKRFRTEARAVSLLTHPNTVQVFDFGEAEGSLYMVMELVRGESLAALVVRQGPLPWRRAAPILVQVCEALAEAHEAGVVHRDVKPENILVVRTREGRESVKVVDFGLAKLRAQRELASTTGRGAIVGTPYFMSPEQIRGESLDARSDIYSLGATAYDLLTGEHPFDGESPMKVLTAHLTDELVLPSRRRADLDIDPRVDALLGRCLARDPAGRFATADELRHAIEELREPTGPRRQAATDASGALPGRRAGAEPSGTYPRGVAGGEASGPVRVATPQLSREDFDRFERGLRRRRWMAQVGLAVTLLGMLGAGGWLLLRGDTWRPVSEEVEPNNDAASANPIAERQPVRGHIGKRLSLETSDRDFFHLRVPKGPVVAHFELSPIPNIDLHMAVFDRYGEKIGEAGAGGAGVGEAIPNARLDAGDHFVEVREEWVAGGMATENVTDQYSLRASWHDLTSDEESEPDDTPATALPVPLARPFIGFAGRPGDVDYYYPRGEPGGLLDGRVSGVAGVDLRLIVLPPGSTASGDPAAVPGARVFDTGGPGEPEAFSGLAWPGSGGAMILVVARKDKPAATGSGRPSVGEGFDVPYTLLLSRREAR